MLPPSPSPSPSPFPPPPPPAPAPKPRTTIGVSIYLPQVGTSAAINAFGFDATKFGHMSVFWLPYEINPYGAHGWELWEAKRRCGKNEKQLGKMDTIEECAQAVSRTHRCGPVFVWSPRNSPGSNTWQCTCCKDDYTEGGQT